MSAGSDPDLAVNLAEVAPAATLTDAGRVRPEELVVSAIVSAETGALTSVTVQAALAALPMIWIQLAVGRAHCMPESCPDEVNVSVSL